MRPEPETITLGGKSWLIRPLTLRQVRELAPIAQGGAGPDANKIDLLLAILPIALKRDHADDMPEPDELLDLECGVEEIKTAFDSIMRLAGLRRAESQGEGQAAVSLSRIAAETTGEASTAA